MAALAAYTLAAGAFKDPTLFDLLPAIASTKISKLPVCGQTISPGSLAEPPANVVVPSYKTVGGVAPPPGWLASWESMSACAAVAVACA